MQTAYHVHGNADRGVPVGNSVNAFLRCCGKRHGGWTTQDADSDWQAAMRRSEGLHWRQASVCAPCKEPAETDSSDETPTIESPTFKPACSAGLDGRTEVTVRCTPVRFCG